MSVSNLSDIYLPLHSADLSTKMTSILVTGGNRGLGLGLVKKLLERKDDPPGLVIATCRSRTSPASADLMLLAADPRLRVVELDVTDTSSFPAFAEKVSKIVGDYGLNVLVNMAGIHRQKVVFDDVTEDDYLATYQTNVIGPVFLIKALLPLIQMANVKNSAKPMGKDRAAILNISSLLGSVSLNTVSSHYSYRESKAALNTFTINLAIDLGSTGILALPIHPGWVQTDLGGSRAPLTVDTATSGLVEVIYNLKESQNGKFLQWDGKELAW